MPLNIPLVRALQSRFDWHDVATSLLVLPPLHSFHCCILSDRGTPKCTILLFNSINMALHSRLAAMPIVMLLLHLFLFFLLCASFTAATCPIGEAQSAQGDGCIEVKTEKSKLFKSNTRSIFLPNFFCSPEVKIQSEFKFQI